MSNRLATPRGWSSSAIGSVCAFTRGVSWKKSQERRFPTAGAVPVLRIPNVQKTLELTELLYIDGLTEVQQAKARVEEGWTLLVGSNGNPRRVGNCVYVAEPRGFLFASFLIGAKSTDPERVDNELGAALLHRGFFALFMGSFARGCVSPVAISGGTSSRPARTGVFSAASRASSRRRTPSVFSPTGALPSGHSRGVLVRCRGKGGRPAMAVTTGFQRRTFDVPRTGVPCIDPPRRAPCAAADAVFADAKAFLSSSEARQMSESELERELHRRGQELVRKLLQGHRDQRSPKEAAGPAEDTSGVECSEPREHESHAETASGTMQVVGLGCARRGHDGLHRLDAALNLLPERYWVEMRRRVTLATASRAPPRTPWKPPWYSTSSTWQRRRGVRCSSPAHRRACRHLVRDPMGDDRRSAAAGSRSLDADCRRTWPARCWRAAWTSGGYGSVEPCKLFPAAPLHPPRRPMRRRRLLSRRPKPTFLRARPCRCVRATSNGS